MVTAYWEIGKRILEQQQLGEKRADYSGSQLKRLSKRLSADFGKGFAIASLKNYRKFYLAFSAGQKSSPAASLLRAHTQNVKSSAWMSQSSESTDLNSYCWLRSELTWTHYGTNASRKFKYLRL